MSHPAEETHFGERKVRLDEKQGLVDDVFQKVANRYDLMNDLMSGGLHRVWKDILVAKAHPSQRRAYRHLDVAGGTGDVAFRVAKAGGPDTEVTVLDINPEMLRVGEERAQKRRGGDRVTFVEGNAEGLPFESDAFNGYTIAFGIRNVPRIERALGEAFRVLKRGSRFLCLEFSQVDLPVLDKTLFLLFRRRDPGARQGRHGRRRALSLSRRIDPQVSGPRGVRQHDRGRGFCARGFYAAQRRHRRHSLRLEALTISC